MRKRRVTPIGAAFVALVLLVLLFVVRGALHRPAHVVLPQDASSSDVSDASLDDSAVGRIAVRPDTVQSAIATLERPARSSRAITIERYYSGGSGVDRSNAARCGCKPSPLQRRWNMRRRPEIHVDSGLRRIIRSNQTILHEHNG